MIFRITVAFGGGGGGDVSYFNATMVNFTIRQ